MQRWTKCGVTDSQADSDSYLRSANTINDNNSTIKNRFFMKKFITTRLRYFRKYA